MIFIAITTITLPSTTTTITITTAAADNTATVSGTANHVGGLGGGSSSCNINLSEFFVITKSGLS